jgi:hypothetical protein
MVTPEKLDEMEVTGLLEATYNTHYVLDKEDQDTILRIIEYGKNMSGLTKEEVDKLKEANIVDKNDNRLMIEDAFYFRGTILPSFWLKCLMALRDLLILDDNFVSEENETAPI